MRFHTHLSQAGRIPFVLATLEGGEGVGKSTQITLLKEKFPEASFYREPGSTEFGQQMRTALMAENVSARAQAFAFLAARTQLTHHIVYEDTNSIVFIDRFIDSTMAYQGYGSDFSILSKSAIEACNFWATAYQDARVSVEQTLTPTMTFLLDVPVEVLLERIATRGAENKYDRADIAYHKKVLDGYDKIMLEDTTNRFVIVDGTKEPNVICDEIMTHVQLAYDAMKLQPRWMR